MTRPTRTNTELNAFGILRSFNISNTETLEAAGDTQTKSPSKKGIHVEGISS